MYSCLEYVNKKFYNVFKVKLGTVHYLGGGVGWLDWGVGQSFKNRFGGRPM